MTNTQTLLYVIVNALMVFGISAIMEIYKKTIRKNKSKKWENICVSLTLSILSVLSLKLINIFHPILGILGAPIWTDYVLYSAIYFVLQRQADMKLIKNLIKSYCSSLLKNAGFSTEQINDIMNIAKSAETSDESSK